MIDLTDLKDLQKELDTAIKMIERINLRHHYYMEKIRALGLTNKQADDLAKILYGND